MIFVWGTRLYGKVDEVPGKFHVATQFGHLWFIPLFPARSWVIFKQHGNHFRGVKIGWNLKSILVGWAVAASTLLIAIGGPILLIVAQRSYPKTDDFIPPATAVVAGIATLVVIFTVPGIRRASHARAMMLARKIGATAEFQQKLDEHFNRPFGMGGAFPVEARSAPQVASADAQPIEATGALIETIETNPSASKSAPKLGI